MHTKVSVSVTTFVIFTWHLPAMKHKKTVENIFQWMPLDMKGHESCVNHWEELHQHWQAKSACHIINKPNLPVTWTDGQIMAVTKIINRLILYETLLTVLQSLNSSPNMSSLRVTVFDTEGTCMPWSDL